MMNNLKKRQLPISTLGYERILGLSDGVFAIIITLMVIELKVPKVETHDEWVLWEQLQKSIPILISMIISFLVIGILWIEHHRLFRYIKSYDLGLIWRNLVFLGAISFIPFPTALYAEYGWSQISFVLYAMTIGMCGYTKVELMKYAWKHDLISSEISAENYCKMHGRSFALPFTASIAAIVGAISSPLWGAAVFGLLPLLSNVCAKHGGFNVRKFYSDWHRNHHAPRS